MTPDSEQLQSLVQQIIEAVHPVRIVLFGSAARGEMRPDSDLDILVVMPDGTHRRQTMRTLYRTIHGVKIPFDLIVATPTDLATYRNTPGLIYHAILEEGQTLYAA
jgi:predicted nucleotidyltransferase